MEKDLRIKLDSTHAVYGRVEGSLISFTKTRYGVTGGKLIKSVNGYLMPWGASTVINKEANPTRGLASFLIK